MNYINISRKTSYDGKISACSSQLDNEHAVQNILKDKGFWSSQKNNSLIHEYFIVDYGSIVPIDAVQISASPTGKATFPSDFRIESSTDGICWKAIITERKFDLEDSLSYMLDVPVTLTRFVKFLSLRPKKVGAKYFVEIGRFTALINGIKEISVSSSLSYENAAEKLLDDDKSTFWESDNKPAADREHIEIDMGRVFHINRISCLSSDKSPNGFPESFFIEVSADKNIWTTIFEEKNFLAQTNTKYTWDIPATPARFLRMDMNTVSMENKMFASRLSGLQIFAAVMNQEHTHNIGALTPHASIFEPGVIRLAKDGENTQGAAVQGNDRRLRDATTIFKGIVQFSEDGDVRPGLAVQASDSRIKGATESRTGIVRFAYDREANPQAAVQGNDSRLREATENSSGIVKFCPDGVYSEISVLRGNDSRIKKATISSFGICRLAQDGENNPECVVQGNDSRLRNGSVNNKGIVELADDGEDSPDVVVQGNDRRLKDATATSKGIVELAENGEESPGVVVQGDDRRLKDATTESKGIVELGHDGEDRPGVVVQGNDRRLKDATEAAKGILRFASDGEFAPLAAVQSSDNRLKDATTTSKGIAELAENGEDAPGVVVQGNDRRLKDATVISKGIVELAKDGEDSPGVVVQGDDRRLKDATTESKGIVELAEDGEARPGVAVQASDRRLKDATADMKGIVELAKDGEDGPGVVVQGNDRRLKDATTTSKGIIELAEDGEDKPGVVVQGNDRRIKDASTAFKGIVELAEDGEEGAGVVIQGNDRRLKPATVNASGIVRLAKNGELKSGVAVQADDKRLSDLREALPHSHEYAPLHHEFSGHKGTIEIIEKHAEKFSGIVPPSNGSAVVYAKNESPNDGAVAVAGVSDGAKDSIGYSYGLLGHSRFVGVRGQSSGKSDSDVKGCGVMGVSRFGAGGVFSSEHSFSLIADGYGKISEYDDTVNLVGNGDALLVNGASEFNGKIKLQNKEKENEFPANIVEMFEVDNVDYISSGDLLVIHGKGKSILSISNKSYSKAVIGVVSGNPTLVLNNAGESKKVYPIVLSGKTLCKVDARSRPIKPGDLIVSSDTPGCGMAGDMDGFDKIGTVIGKALDSLEEGIGIIPIFVIHL